jgi:hypothetical protein
VLALAFRTDSSTPSVLLVPAVPPFIVVESSSFIVVDGLNGLDRRESRARRESRDIGPEGEDNVESGGAVDARFVVSRYNRALSFLVRYHLAQLLGILRSCLVTLYALGCREEAKLDTAP